MATDSLHLPRLIFWLQFIAKERETACQHLLLFCSFVLLMSGDPADLKQSGNGGLPSDLPQFLNHHSWVTCGSVGDELPCECLSVYLVTPGGRVPVQDHMTQTYGFGNRPKCFACIFERSDLEIHGDSRVVQSLVHKEAALYPPVFVQGLLSTSIRTKRHRVWVPNVAQMDCSYPYTGLDEPDPAGVSACLDRLTALSGQTGAPS